VPRQHRDTVRVWGPRGGDDRIGGAQELRPTPSNLQDARSGLSMPLATGVFRGDGGRYILHFDPTHTPR
jgi:hypothetical protein